MGDLDGFDANEVEPTGDFEPIPKDDYTVIATETEWKDTKSGNGAYLQFLLEVVEGEHKGRKVWDRLNLKNQSDQAVRIANGTLSSICRAVGVMRPKDSNELCNKPMIASIVVEERNDKKGVFKNEVKNYSPVGEKPTTAAKTASSNGGSKPPWAK